MKTLVLAVFVIMMSAQVALAGMTTTTERTCEGIHCQTCTTTCWDNGNGYVSCQTYCN